MSLEKYMVENQMYYDNFRIKKGDSKVSKIVKTINNSKHTGSFLYQSRQKRIVPRAFDFGACVNSNFLLGISGFDNTKFAAIMLLDKWNNEVNSELGLIDDNELLSLFYEIKKLG